MRSLERYRSDSSDREFTGVSNGSDSSLSSEHSLTIEEVHALKSNLPGIFSLWAIRATLCMEWLDYGSELPAQRRELFVEQHVNSGLIWALLLTVAATGMFADPGAHPEYGSGIIWYVERLFGFFWCSSVFLLGFATILSVFFVVAASRVRSDVEFEQFADLMGKHSLRIPLYFGFWGMLMLSCGVVSYFALRWTPHYAVCCLVVCAMLFPIVQYVFQKMSWALRVVHETTIMRGSKYTGIEVTAEDIHHSLEVYFTTEKQGKFHLLRRAEFLKQFEAMGSETTYILASKIYDRFVDKHIDSMLGALDI